jgi:hypothetical protein
VFLLRFYFLRLLQQHLLQKRSLWKVSWTKKQTESYPGAQDWGLSVSPSFTRLGEASSSYEASGQSERIYLFGTEAALSRQIWNTGGTLGFSISTDYKNSEYQSVGSKAFKHGVGISYTQPLMQNYKGTLDRLNYELSDYTIEFTEVQARENKEDFLLGVASRYLDWVGLTEVIDIAKGRLSLANEQLDQVVKRFNANLVDKVDVLRAEDAVRLSFSSSPGGKRHRQSLR